jgi:hypothetical protein
MCIVNCKMHVNWSELSMCAALFQKVCQGKRHYFTLCFFLSEVFTFTPKTLWADKETWKNANLMYFSNTGLFLSFTKETTGKMKKFTQI